MGKVTFIHISKNTRRGEGPIYLMPMGLVALADFLLKNNVDSEIIHLEVEKNLNHDFNLIDYLKSNDRKIFCFDLHWHPQSRGVIEIIKRIKRNVPASHIIIGGFTASFFAEEIMKNFSEVDFIIKGDAEIPLLKLVQKLKTKEKIYQSIPNLVWRNGEEIITNKQNYIVSQKIIDNLNFSNFGLIKNYREYVKILFTSSPSGYQKTRGGIFYYNCGRGCSVKCSFCGGSNTAQKMINNRAKVVLIKPGSVIKNLRTATNFGIKEWYTSFDPYPHGDYYLKLFKKIRKSKIKIGLSFESWALPTKDFIDEFSKTFNKNRSKIIISPECGSEEVRRKNKGYYFSNQELIDILEYIETEKIGVELYFTAGLPFEKREDIIKTAKLIKFLKRNFRNILFSIFAIAIEPASPWSLDKKYGVSTKRKRFIDYYNVFKRKYSLGYRTKYFKEREIGSIIDWLRNEG